MLSLREKFCSMASSNRKVWDATKPNMITHLQSDRIITIVNRVVTYAL